MSLDTLLIRDPYSYGSDDGNVYQIGTTQANGLANGATPIVVNSIPSLPRRYYPREVYGIDLTGHRTKVPCFSIAAPLWTTATTFSKNDTSYTIEGRRGERRT